MSLNFPFNRPVQELEFDYDCRSGLCCPYCLGFVPIPIDEDPREGLYRDESGCWWASSSYKLRAHSYLYTCSYGDFEIVTSLEKVEEVFTFPDVSIL